MKLKKKTQSLIDPKVWGEALKKQGFNFFTGVPCSYLKQLIQYTENQNNYFAATNEGEAVAIAAGAWLAGKRSVVLLQNSGLPNALAPLTSLNHPFKMPVLGFVGYRGQSPATSEPQHKLMGEVSEELLKTAKIHVELLSKDAERMEAQLEEAAQKIEAQESVFFLVEENAFTQSDENKVEVDTKAEGSLTRSSQSVTERPTRWQVLEELVRVKDRDTVLLAATGRCGRELFAIEDSPQHFYMVGSMGCVSSLGFGIAASHNNAKVIAIDGDGALLMRMGSLATHGFYRSPNMLHLVLDNEAHDTTGGQATVSSNVDFAQIAASAGYPKSFEIRTVEELQQIIQKWKANPELTFVALKIAKGNQPGVGRPSVAPEEVAIRLKGYLEELS